MKTKNVLLTLNFLIIIGLITPVFLQSIQTRHYRPLPDKCDRYGRCSPKEGYIEEVDDYKSEKERPTVLTRDDWPVRPQTGKDTYDERDVNKGDKTGGGYGDSHDTKPPVEYDDDKKSSGGGRPSSGYNPKPVERDDGLKPSSGRPGGGYGGGYNPKPTADRDDDIKPSGGGRPGGGYIPKPLADRDDDIKPSGGGRPGGGYVPKPARDRDDDITPSGSGRPGSGSDYDGGYKPKPAVDRHDDYKPTGGGRPGGGYNPKPVAVIDDDIKPSGGGRPSGGSGGYGGVYKPKPSDDRDDDLKPTGGGRPGGSGGYNPKPVINRDDDIKPIGRPDDGDGYRGNYKPKPAVGTGDDRNPTRGRPSGGGGYNPKPVVDSGDYDIKPTGGLINKPGGNRGGHNPKPDDDSYIPEDDRKPSNDDYNDYGKDDEYEEGKPIPVVEGNCICVPYYQCQEGHIVTDGGGIIDARRKRPEPDDELPLDGKFKPPSCGPYHVCCNTPESSTVRPYEHRCGVRNPSGINSRILSPSNKGEADFGEWPWQAAVLKSEGKVNIFMCGGVLIDKYHVVTVAHCVFHLYQLNEYPLKVRLGEWDTQTTTEFLAHEDYKVSKIIVHPEYRNTSLWNDVAVLRLQDPVLFAPHIDTVCLPKYDEAFAGENCVVTGWGKDAYKGGTFSNVMKEVALQVIDNYKCEEMLRKTRLGRFFQLHEGFLCAGGEYGIDSCKGDGGGPLVCYRKDKSYALAGIVSWGIDCGQPEVPGVYVKIQKYLDWISKTTGVTLQDYWPKH